MIELNGSKQIGCPPDKLYAELSDVSRLVTTLPDVKTVKESSQDKAVIVVVPGFSFVKGELDTTITRSSAVPNSNVALTIHSKGIGTTLAVQASLTLTPIEAGTQLDWQASVTEIGGLLKLVPASLLKGAAQKVIDNWFTSLAQRLAA